MGPQLLGLIPLNYNAKHWLSDGQTILPSPATDGF